MRQILNFLKIFFCHFFQKTWNLWQNSPYPKCFWKIGENSPQKNHSFTGFTGFTGFTAWHFISVEFVIQYIAQYLLLQSCNQSLFSESLGLAICSSSKFKVYQILTVSQYWLTLVQWQLQHMSVEQLINFEDSVSKIKIPQYSKRLIIFHSQSMG